MIVSDGVVIPLMVVKVFVLKLVIPVVSVF